MRLTPHSARVYLLLAAFLLALPTLATFYKGQTGKLLVAVGSNMIQGTPFYESVVYVADHNLFSAYGYIINSPFNEEQTKRILAGRKVDVPVLYGGPVGQGNSSVFTGLGENGEIAFSSVERDLKDARLLFGYAGWAPLQLNYELSRGHWVVIDYSSELIFETPPHEIWHKAREEFLKKALMDEKIL